MSATYEELLERYLQQNPYPPLFDPSLHERLIDLTEARADDTDPERTTGAYGCQRATSQPEHRWREHQIGRIQSLEPARWPIARSGGPRFTEADIVEIRETYARGELTLAQIGAAYGIDDAQVSKIVRGDRYPHASGPITRRGSGNRPPNRQRATS